MFYVDRNNTLSSVNFYRKWNNEKVKPLTGVHQDSRQLSAMYYHPQSNETCTYSHSFTKTPKGKSQVYTAIYLRLVMNGMTWVAISLIMSAVRLRMHCLTLNQRTTIIIFLSSVVPSHRLLWTKSVTPFVLLFPVQMQFQGSDLQIARGYLLNSVSITIIPKLKKVGGTDWVVSTQRRYQTARPVWVKIPILCLWIMAKQLLLLD